MSGTCPLCGGALGETPAEALTHLPLTGREKAIVDALLAVYPAPLPAYRLIYQVYALDIDGGPLNAANTIAATICRINPRFRLLGWEIRGPNSGGHRAGRQFFKVNS